MAKFRACFRSAWHSRSKTMPIKNNICLCVASSLPSPTAAEHNMWWGSHASLADALWSGSDDEAVNPCENASAARASNSLTATTASTPSHQFELAASLAVPAKLATLVSLGCDDYIGASPSDAPAAMACSDAVAASSAGGGSLPHQTTVADCHSESASGDSPPHQTTDADSDSEAASGDRPLHQATDADSDAEPRDTLIELLFATPAPAPPTPPRRERSRSPNSVAIRALLQDLVSCGEVTRVSATAVKAAEVRAGPRAAPLYNEDTVMEKLRVLGNKYGEKLEFYFDIDPYISVRQHVLDLVSMGLPYYIGISGCLELRLEKHMVGERRLMLVWRTDQLAEILNVEFDMIEKYGGHRLCENVRAGGGGNLRTAPFFLYIRYGHE